MFYIDLYSENIEKSSSEITRPRALIFGMKHYLVDLYKVCSNYGPWTENGPALGVTCFTLT